MSEPNFEGTKKNIGGDNYIIPALSLKQVKNLKPEIDLVSDSTSDQDIRFDAMSKIIFTALSRNYPDITEDQVKDMLDLNNILEIIDAVMNVSGFKKRLGEMLAGNV